MMYRAWLGDMLLGEGNTREEAIEAAIQEYEQQAGEPPYGDYPRFPSRDALIAALSVDESDE